MIKSQITFESHDDRELLLEGVQYDVQIDGLMATTTITQNYTNPYDTNIEAVYTFPLSVDSVLFGIEIRINDRVLKGVIKEKNEAEATYEEAIDESNRAIMVEKQSDGIYTINIANLLPWDKISVSIKYAQLLEWRQDQIKWSLPTTIAPKYGTPSDLNLDDVRDPAISLLVENLFSFTMRIKGLLADSEIDAPSHKIQINREEAETKVTLQNGKGLMNKDIVFTFKTQKSREERSFALMGKDFDGYAAIASFYPSFGIDLPRQPKSVTFLIDCSGSMLGVSIDKARTALNKALHLLTEEDSFNIIKFGTHYKALFKKEVPATQKNLNIAKKMVRSMYADMGGTEMKAALQSAYARHLSSKEKQSYLFLITDGEIYDHKGVIEAAERSEMAHFIVGVGYATDDPLLRKIAKVTRGSYENIDPNEKMDHYILNLFKKIDMPKASNIKVEWPLQPMMEHAPDIIFDDDTLYTYAMFDEKPQGEVRLSYCLENGEEYYSTVPLPNIVEEGEPPSIEARMVVAKEIEALNTKRLQGMRHREENKNEETKAIVELSTKYQLFSELTNYILIDEIRESEKPTGFPYMHMVESMMVEQTSKSYSRNNICYSNKMAVEEDISDIPTFYRIDPEDASFTSVSSRKNPSDIDSYELPGRSPSTLGRDAIDTIWHSISSFDHKRYIELLDAWYIKHKRLPRTKEELLLAGFHKKVVALFDSRNFREQIRLFVLKLYREVDIDSLSDAFKAYLQKFTTKQIASTKTDCKTNRGLAGKLTQYLMRMF